jgi:hypothetical protein
MEVSGQLHTLAVLPTEKDPLVTPWVGICVGSRDVLDARVKRKIPSFCRDKNHRSFSPQPIVIPIELKAK